MRRRASRWPWLLLGLGVGTVLHVALAWLLLAAGFFAARPAVGEVPAVHAGGWSALAAVLVGAFLCLRPGSSTASRAHARALVPFGVAAAVLLASLTDLHVFVLYDVAWEPYLFWDTLVHLVPLLLLVALWGPVRTTLVAPRARTSSGSSPAGAP